jgi:hypothetical protein
MENFTNTHSMGSGVEPQQKELFLRIPICCVDCGYDLVVDFGQEDLKAVSEYKYTRPCPKCHESMFTIYIPYAPR